MRPLCFAPVALLTARRRDIKPHNFVFDSTLHLRLVDFGSAAALLPATRDGVQLVPKRLCLVPCGTCDYISPEILNAHEEALVALETENAENSAEYDPSQGGYGKEVDWWSFGAMFYELAFGIAPFYAKDIRRTYTKIVDHQVCKLRTLCRLRLTRLQRNLAFPAQDIVSQACVDLLSKYVLPEGLGPSSFQHIPGCYVITKVGLVARVRGKCARMYSFEIPTGRRYICVRDAPGKYSFRNLTRIVQRRPQLPCISPRSQTHLRQSRPRCLQKSL